MKQIAQVFNKVVVLMSVILLLGTSIFTQAAPPQTISYQAYIKDSAGLPLTGSPTLTIRIYDAATGGTLLWSDSFMPALTDGLLSLELGRPGNLLPIASMTNPLWLGVEINSDGEASPRTELHSVNNAFRAEDSDTLQGQTAASLDQSTHVADTANPHGVTAAQVGAATAADITTHAGDVSAHHTRYSDPEAIVAMGAKGDANALHHDKYTNANSVAALLAADGAGSNLDADQVDGLEAAELIDAASDEVRTPISSLPFTISTPGSYYVTGNLDGSAGGIDINVDNVTLDLMGFTLDGGTGSVNDYGIELSGNDITIRNGKVRDFGRSGVYQSAIYTQAHIIRIQVTENGDLGSPGTEAGISLGGLNSIVHGCTALFNQGSGILGGISSLIKDSTASQNLEIGISTFDGSLLVNNTARSNTGEGIVGSGSGITFINNAAHENNQAGILGGVGSTFTNNSVSLNQGNGIEGGDGSSFTNNTVTSSQNHGIKGGIGTTISGNTVSSSQSNGINGGVGSAISGNTVYNNQGWGIYASGSSSVSENTVYSNNLSQSVTAGGIRIGQDSMVTSNTVDENYRRGIDVAAEDSVLRYNHVTDSLVVGGNSHCIFFSSNVNAAIGNTVAGCLIDYGGILPPASRYIDNITF